MIPYISEAVDLAQRVKLVPLQLGFLVLIAGVMFDAGNANHGIRIINFVRQHPAYDNEQVRAIDLVLAQIGLDDVPHLRTDTQTLDAAMDEALNWLRNHELASI